jgi:hypothetical protein
MYKDVVNRDSTFRALSEDFRFPVSRLYDRAIPSERPSDNCSIRLDDVTYRPDASQTKHHRFGQRAFPSGPSTVSKRFYPACIRPDVSTARPDTSRYSTGLRFFPSSNKRKINQPSGRCGISSGRASPQGKNCNSNTPVRTSDSLGPDEHSSKKEIADSTSTVRTTAYHGSDACTSVMEIAC